MAEPRACWRMLLALCAAGSAAGTSAAVRVNGAQSVAECLLAATSAADGEATVCTLAGGVLRPDAAAAAAPAGPLRGPLTVRGAGSAAGAARTTLSGALPVPSSGWELDPAARGRPIYVAKLPTGLWSTESGGEPRQVFVDNNFISEARWPDAVRTAWCLPYASDADCCGCTSCCCHRRRTLW